MKEAYITKKIVEALNLLPSCHAEKRWTGGIYSRVGASDVTGAIRGRRFEIEVKVPGEEMRPVQRAYLKAWEEVGAIVGCAHSVEEALAIVKST